MAVKGEGGGSRVGRGNVHDDKQILKTKGEGRKEKRKLQLIGQMVQEKKTIESPEDQGNELDQNQKSKKDKLATMQPGTARTENKTIKTRGGGGTDVKLKFEVSLHKER